MDKPAPRLRFGKLIQVYNCTWSDDGRRIEVDYNKGNPGVYGEGPEETQLRCGADYRSRFTFPFLVVRPFPNTSYSPHFCMKLYAEYLQTKAPH